MEWREKRMERCGDFKGERGRRSGGAEVLGVGGREQTEEIRKMST